MSQKSLPEMEITIEERKVAVGFRKNARARRYTLRIGRDGKPIVTLPPGGNVEEAMVFVIKNRSWIQQRLESHGGSIEICPGILMPIRGKDTILHHRGGMRGLAQMSDNTSGRPVLAISGPEEHFSRRVLDWLKREARADLEEACRYHAANLGVRVTSITVRDQKSRWGSCSSIGRLNFSWRLILAPSEVLDYVAAHEVAHILEMNHQPQFWRLVEKTCPGLSHPRKWLKLNGASLHRYVSS